ncbi:polyprenyl synthetase family protein [Trueperella sp. LYQ143]|uniref:polyprenyl synthetase family protein n=1 Tax=unclassified Trueperella TaxID=2630174 RepID=UPI003983420D
MALDRSMLTAQLNHILTVPPHFLDGISEHTDWKQLCAPARDLAQSGKHVRAQFVAAGYHGYHGPQRCGHDEALNAYLAVELYQLSALVHDDIIDEAATRRGHPAAHIAFRDAHTPQTTPQNAADYGRKAGILLGDLLLSLAAIAMTQAPGADIEAERRAQQLFHEMTAETAFGQFIDTRAQFLPLHTDLQQAYQHAMNVVIHKSARYSVELPLLIGAALAGASEEERNTLSHVGRPLGIAFQLRDDELGIFGDSQKTGKPAGGDIIEGKQTVLLALARERASSQDRKRLEDMLGQPLTHTEVAEFSAIVRECGAWQAHEDLIAQYELHAYQAAQKLPPNPLLQELIEQLRHRRA